MVIEFRVQGLGSRVSCKTRTYNQRLKILKPQHLNQSLNTS